MGRVDGDDVGGVRPEGLEVTLEARDIARSTTLYCGFHKQSTLHNH